MDFAHLTLPEVSSDVENMYSMWSDANETQMLLTPLASSGMPSAKTNFSLSELSPANSLLSLSPEMNDLNLDPMAIMQSAAVAAAVAAFQSPQKHHESHLSFIDYSTPITPPSFHSAVIPNAPSPDLMQYHFMQQQLTPEMHDMSPIPISRMPISKKEHKSKKPHRVTADNVDGVFPCTFPSCGKVFTKQYNLRSHLRIHYVPKSHTCTQCPASFRRSHDLRRHERSHESTKAFSCFKCTKGFTRADALKRHHTRPSSPCFMGI